MMLKQIFSCAIIIFISSCKGKPIVHKEPGAETTLNSSSCPPEIQIIEHNFFSANAVAENIYADTLFAAEIDQYLVQLQKQNDCNSSIGEMLCYYEATKKLDTLTELLYQKILPKLKSNKDRKLFIAAQNNWHTYYKNERNFLHQIYWKQNSAAYGFGTGHNALQAQWTFQIGRQRLILLKNIDNTLPN